MRRTSLADLLAPFVILAAAVYVLVRAYYDSLPPLNYAVGVPIAGLAIGELVAARRVRAAVNHDPDAKAMAAIVIARCVALGKASALVAAALAGAMTGLLVGVIPDAGRVSAAESDTRAGIIILLASLLLLVSGLLLERAGIVPRGPTTVQSHM